MSWSSKNSKEQIQFYISQQDEYKLICIFYIFICKMKTM